MNIHFKRCRKSLSWLGLAGLILAILGVGTAQAAPPEPYMVKDINTDTLGSASSQLVNVGSTLFFASNGDSDEYNELWKSDGTQAGTVLVKAISSESTHSNLLELTGVNGTLFFVSESALWKSDGTQAGTVLVKDFDPEQEHLHPAGLTSMNGTLFFVTDDGVHGYELWKSDGTEAGTMLVKDINPAGSSISYWPERLVNVNGTLFFGADDGIHGYELWKSDGTQAGTVLLKDINPGEDGSYLGGTADVDGMLFFGASYGDHSGLYKSDGTEAGTALVKDFYPGPGPWSLGSLTNADGALFFIFGYEHHKELWVSDGTEAGTVLLKDIDANLGYYSDPLCLTNVGGTLFFTADDGVHGWELYKSDGTEAGTLLVKDINPAGSSFSIWCDELDNVSFDQAHDALFFVADDGVHGEELWKSDGTEAGTVLFKDINPGPGDSTPRELTDVNGVLFFLANDGVHGEELHKSDGTGAGTVLVKDINVKTSNSRPSSLVDMDGTLFFKADDGIHGEELWTSNGTGAGTMLFKDIRPGEYGSGPQELTIASGAPFGLAHDVLFFSASDDVHGYELWKSDGTEAGTVLVKDINPGDGHSRPEKLTEREGTFFFSADDGIHGRELWKSDGTQAGTLLVKDINPAGPGSVYGDYKLINVQGTLFFVADDGVHGYELWKSDGTEAGTVQVKDINPAGSSLSNSYVHIASIHDTLFFVADDGIHGWELWKSDGTEAGTVLVKDINPAGSGISIWYKELVNVSFDQAHDVLFFRADDGVHGEELWKSDGTEAGTVLVKDINPGGGDSRTCEMTEMDGVLFFSADDDYYGERLWKSDGTEAGTVVVKRINSWSGIAHIEELTNANGTLFLVADDGVHGSELWVSDGTEAGTTLVADIRPGSDWLGPTRLTCVSGGPHDMLFFSVSVDDYGNELWALDVAANLALTQTVILPTTDLFPGDPLTFTLAYTNDGYASASDIIIRDHLDPALTQVGFVSSGATITRVAGVTYAWQVEDLAPGAGGVITITSVVNPDFSGGVLSNTATITSAEAEIKTDDNSSTVQVIVQTPALRVQKTVRGANDATTNLAVNDTVTYSITLDNSLNELAAGVTLTDPLPAGVRFGGWVQQGSAQLPPPAGTGTLGAGVIRWGPWDLPAGEAASIVFTATVAPGSAWLGNPVVNTAWFSSTNAGSGSASAVFSIKVMDVFLPLLMKQ